MIVDTSVWVDFFRGRDRKLVKELTYLLDDDRVALASPIRLELLTGASNRELPHLRRLLSALPLLVPGPSLWGMLETWVTVARAQGERVGAFDLLIAGVTHEHEAWVWSLDDDFTRMGRLGFVRVYEV